MGFKLKLLLGVGRAGCGTLLVVFVCCRVVLGRILVLQLWDFELKALVLMEELEARIFTLPRHLERLLLRLKTLEGQHREHQLLLFQGLGAQNPREKVV